MFEGRTVGSGQACFFPACPKKFTKSTKEQLKYQSDQIDILDKQMSKLKDEMRVQLEYKQRLEDKRNKSKQITITLNNLL